MSTSGEGPTRGGPPAHRRGRVLVAGALAVVLLAGCGSDEPRPAAAPGDEVGVPTTPVPPTTMQDLGDIVDVTDRPAVTAGPPGDGAAVDVTEQVRAVAASLARRNGPYAGGATELIDDLAEEMVGSFGGGCEVAPEVDTSVAGSGSASAVGTIELVGGCDDAIEGVRFVVSLSTSSGGSGSDGWQVTAATRTAHCSRGVSEGLCV